MIQMQIAIKLASGHSVILDSLHFTHTYAGVIMGLPTPEMNAKILDNASSRMTPLWGPRTTHIIPPVTREDRGHTIFPALMFYAWLSSYTPIKPGFDGAELVVVWFAPELPDVPLTTVVTQAVRDISWDTLATDFYL